MALELSWMNCSTDSLDSDGRKLTIAEFYFWNVGSEYEKSLRGIYRSLLYQILQDCPELMATALPTQYGQAMSGSWLIHKNIKLVENDIVKAFSNIINSPHLHGNNCVCLFIDGLDELQPTVQNDYKDVVDLLRRWTAISPGNVNICVSSRENLVFMNAFSDQYRVRLHELTRYDMEVYIQERLAHASGDEGQESLISSIIDKANGVFLWVALVVKSLREGLDNGLSCAELTHKVDILPDEMKGLYMHILQSLDSAVRRRTYQTFAMMTELKKYDHRMSLLAYSFLDDYERDGCSSINNTTPFETIGLTGLRGKQRSESSRKRLAGRCKGLVELYGTVDGVLELDFSHRTVLEFLDSDGLKAGMKSDLKGFDHVDAISNVLIVDVLFDAEKISERCVQTIYVLLRMRQNHNLDQVPYTYLNRLRMLTYTEFKPGQFIGALSLRNTRLNQSNRIFDLHPFYYKAPPAKGTRKDDTGGLLADPLHKLTCSGLCDYPVWYISHKAADISQQPYGLSMLACYCIWRGVIWRYQIGPQRRVLEALFEGKLMCPDTIMDCNPFFGYGDNYVSIPYLTIWQYFMLGVISRYCTGMMSLKKETEENQSIGAYLELFLRFMPNMNFSFSMDGIRKFLCYFGKSSHIQNIGIEMKGEGRLLGLRSANYKEFRTATSTEGDHSLRELVEQCPFSNKERLLQMIDTDPQRGARGEARPEEETHRDTSTSQNWEIAQHPSSDNEAGTGSSKADRSHDIVASNLDAPHNEARQQIAMLVGGEYFRYGLTALIG